MSGELSSEVPKISLYYRQPGGNDKKSMNKPDVHKKITFRPHDAVNRLTRCASDCANRETLRDRLVGAFVAFSCPLYVHAD